MSPTGIPKPPMKPGGVQIQVTRATETYTAQNSGEVNIAEGDLVYVLESKDPSKLRVRCGDKEGSLPADFGSTLVFL